MYSHYSLTTSIEAWIDRIIEAGSQTIIMPDGPDSLPTTESVSTPRPSNKRQRQASIEFSNQDAEATPPPLLSYRGHSRDSLSEASSSTNTNGTSRSGRGSPRKREAALRSAPDWPVVRTSLADLKSFPAMLETLGLDLNKIADGRQPLIPDIFQSSMSAEAGILTQPHPEWFYAANDNREELIAVHRQMKRIHRNSVKCKAMMEHEPAWNGLVHCRVLEEALEGQGGVDFRNTTVCRTLRPYHDGGPTLGDDKVDYGIFLQPTQGSDGLAERLADLASNGIDITHFNLSDFAKTPLAISIETKGFGAETFEGDTQLANWVRAHFRHLAYVVDRCGHGQTRSLPVLPTISVSASVWRVDFAHRCDDRTMIYEGITVGNTLTVYGCYQVCAALRRLAAWVRDDFRKFWLEVTELST
ncbi:hypothetical protein MMYC01_201545 [Madurella mycetomatis]|uniref:PD-(D/E)XK nuclease-like domain-containing protein n=1 Tax=Madurella mycetomatis TaxID=100816 RepID=A0A175WEJ6_9PEZI|nr:hypothetical protein MMYC01_201545 [Madurella mycetomatis]